MTPPQLSVVVASVHSSQHTDALLRALRSQCQGRNVEIIVADCSQNSRSQNPDAEYPDVVFLRFPEGETLPNLWGAGIARARGMIIAITDTTCIPDSQWIAAILTAHDTPHPVIGGAVESVEQRRWVDWAAYFCEYGQFMHPLTEGVVSELPGNNISFKRSVLEKGREFVENGFWKTYWCRKLQEEGIQLVSNPSMVVYDKKSYRLAPFLIRRFHHGRCFAGMRIGSSSLLQRGYYLVGAPLLPFLILMRVMKAIVPKGRYLKEFVMSFPFSILAATSWAMGECWGYLTGPGTSCRHVR